MARKGRTGECYLCGTFGPVDGHHLDWHHNNNEPSNIVPLCSQCHSELHKVGYVSREELDAIRQKVKARRPEQFAKTFQDMFGI